MFDKINQNFNILKYDSKKESSSPAANRLPDVSSSVSLSSVTVPVSSLHAYHSISFKGREVKNKEEYNEMLEELYKKADNALKETSADEKIAPQDAIDWLKPLELDEKKLTTYLLACSYDTHKEEVAINKQAVLYAILVKCGLYTIPTAKIPNFIASCLDNEKKCFDSSRFNKLTMCGTLRPSARLKQPREDNYQGARVMSLKHKAFLQKAIEENYKKAEVKKNVDFKYEDLFVPLEETKKDILSELKEASQSTENLPSDLYQKLCDAVNSNDFDIKKIYNDYYLLLNECKDLDDVQKLYPEIPMPFDSIKDKEHTREISGRLSKENLDEIGLDIIKKTYLDFRAPGSIVVNMKNSYPTTYASMVQAGCDFGIVPFGVMNAYRKGTNAISKFRNIDSIEDKKLEFLIKRNASRKSKVWAEYMGITNSQWTKVRAIMHKRKHPETTFYKTNQLVDGYLFYLYKYKKQSIPSENPFKKYSEGTSFTKEKKKFLEDVYFFHINNKYPEIKSEDFLNFKKNFDIPAMEKSVEKMEEKYKNSFFKWFYTPQRVHRYREALNESYNNVFEKLELCDYAKKLQSKGFEDIINGKASNEQLADFMYEDEDIMEQNDECRNLFNSYKNAVEYSNNKELLELFNSYVGESADNVNQDYMQIVDANISGCIKEGKISYPEKIIVPIKLHNEYMTHLLENSDFEKDESEFREEFLSKFKDDNGEINYFEANKTLINKENYSALVSEFEKSKDNEFSQIIASKFVNNNKNNFEQAVELLQMYKNTPERFKPDIMKIASESSKINDEMFSKQLFDFSEKVSYWNLDNDEIITMDADKIPQKVVITSKVKKALYDECAHNFERFDMLIKKFYNAATKRVGDRHGQGVKVLTDNVGYAAELKIQGAQAVGSKRLYARNATQDDIEKYGNVKYIFDEMDEHL